VGNTLLVVKNTARLKKIKLFLGFRYILLTDNKNRRNPAQATKKSCTWSFKKSPQQFSLVSLHNNMTLNVHGLTTQLSMSASGFRISVQSAASWTCSTCIWWCLQPASEWCLRVHVSDAVALQLSCSFLLLPCIKWRKRSLQAVKSTPQDKREKGHLCATKILHHVRKGIISGKQEGCSENEGTLGIWTLAARMKVRLGIQLLQRKWRNAWEFNSCSENEGTLGKSTLAAKTKISLGAQLRQLQSMDSHGFQELGAASMTQIWN
jgi:hypothetical protein